MARKLADKGFLQDFMQDWLDKNIPETAIAQCQYDAKSDCVFCQVTTATHVHQINKISAVDFRNLRPSELMQLVCVNLERAFKPAPCSRPVFTLNELNDAQDFIDACNRS